MNHVAPRQKKDGTWAYCRLNSRQRFAHPIGYCVPFEEWSPDMIGLIFGTNDDAKLRYDAYMEPFRQLQHKFHDGGHPDKASTCECYKEYQLDHELTFHAPDQEEDSDCLNCAHESCEELTSSYARAGKGIGTLIPLCAEHLNRDVVSKLYQPSECWHS